MVKLLNGNSADDEGPALVRLAVGALTAVAEALDPSGAVEELVLRRGPMPRGGEMPFAVDVAEARFLPRGDVVVLVAVEVQPQHLLRELAARGGHRLRVGEAVVVTERAGHLAGRSPRAFEFVIEPHEVIVRLSLLAADRAEVAPALAGPELADIGRAHVRTPVTATSRMPSSS